MYQEMPIKLQSLLRNNRYVRLDAIVEFLEYKIQLNIEQKH